MIPEACDTNKWHGLSLRDNERQCGGSHARCSGEIREPGAQGQSEAEWATLNRNPVVAAVDVRDPPVICSEN